MHVLSMRERMRDQTPKEDLLSKTREAAHYPKSITHMTFVSFFFPFQRLLTVSETFREKNEKIKTQLGKNADFLKQEGIQETKTKTQDILK